MPNFEGENGRSLPLICFLRVAVREDRKGKGATVRKVQYGQKWQKSAAVVRG